MYLVFTRHNVYVEDMNFSTILGLTLNGIFFLDMLMNFIVLGCKNIYLSRRLVIFELVLQIAFGVQLICQLCVDNYYYHSLSDIFFVFLFRNVRFARAMREVKDVDYMFITLFNLTGPILTKFVFLYLVFYEYAQIGVWQFANFSYQDFYDIGAANYYYKMNFNDFPSAIVVLFQQMIVNNWFVVVDYIVQI